MKPGTLLLRRVRELAVRSVASTPSLPEETDGRSAFPGALAVRRRGRRSNRRCGLSVVREAAILPTLTLPALEVPANAGHRCSLRYVRKDRSRRPTAVARRPFALALALLPVLVVVGSPASDLKPGLRYFLIRHRPEVPVMVGCKTGLRAVLQALLLASQWN